MKWSNNELQTLQVSLHFFSDTVIVSKYDDEGGVTTHPVSLTDVAGALVDVPLGSGLLPENTVFWERAGGQDRIGIYVPARRRKMLVRLSKTELEEWTVPLPPLIWIGEGTKYSLFAVKKRPRPGQAATLFVAPAPNVGLGSKSGICAGTVRFPVCAPNTIHRALEMFFTSTFNTHLARNKCLSHPDNVLDLWRKLRDAKRFPLRELLETEEVLR